MEQEQEQDAKSSTHSQVHHEKDGNEKVNKKRYSIEEMEVLRFVHMDYQQRKFERVYLGLEPSVKEDFDSIFEADSGSNKRNRTRNRNKNRRNKQRNKALDGEENSDAGVVIGEEIEINQFSPDQQSHNNNNLKNNKNVDYDISDDDRYDGILKPAFLVEGEPDFESGPPLDGLEYLRRVRWEANQIPDVNIAKLNLHEICNEQTDYMPKIPELPKCPSNLLPSKDWQDSFVSYFSDLRKSISELEISITQDQEIQESPLQTFPSVPTLLYDSILSLHSSFQLDASSDKSPLQSSFQLDTSSDKSPLQSSSQLDASSDNPPLHSSSQLDASSDKQGSCAGDDDDDSKVGVSSFQLVTSTPLHSSSQHDDTEFSPAVDNSKVGVSSFQLDTSSDKPLPTIQSLLTMESVSRTLTLKKYISKVESLETLTFHDCVWLFALCLTVDQPLNADTCAALRSLLRKCLGIIGKREKVDDEVAMVNVLVIVCGKYFGQFDK
ncbi:hypothetical protein LUZ60_007552 [Juncus effusus]|nr:hypothetical protein LUZ60_007552 [Juncus effusus]